jgi:hypothetical protein
MNANNTITIKVKKTPCWKNCEEDDIKVGDTIRWVGQYRVVMVRPEGTPMSDLFSVPCWCVVEEMQVDKITAKSIIGYFGGQYKKVAKGKVFQKRNDKEYNKVGRTDEQRFMSGIKNFKKKVPLIHTCVAEAEGDAWVWFRIQP